MFPVPLVVTNFGDGVPLAQTPRSADLTVTVEAYNREVRWIVVGGMRVDVVYLYVFATMPTNAARVIISE
jgi:hypothetical protein